MFLCDDWLAVNKSDGSIRRTLKPSNAFTAANNSSALVRSNMFHRTVDDHMWLSVGMRAKPSSFTRAQRLATCMATLFLAMITNCMFFKTDDEQTLNSEAISIGPITLTPQQISNSLFSSLIVFPPVLILVVLFSKSVPKGQAARPTAGRTGRKRSGFKLDLPYWCVYIGWVLVVLSITVSAFFTILYSFEWGREKSTAWLTAFLLSFAESVILIQPVKVSSLFYWTFYCCQAQFMCLLNNCLEWDKWVLNERTYPTPDSCLTHLFTRSRAVIAYTVVHLVTPDCTRGVIDPLYHSRHNDRDRQYECDRGIKPI